MTEHQHRQRKRTPPDLSSPAANPAAWAATRRCCRLPAGLLIEHALYDPAGGWSFGDDRRSQRLIASRALLRHLRPSFEMPQPGLGPLAGICAALAAASARYVVFLPVDLPLLPASLIAYLLHHARITGCAVTVPSVNGFAQTFPVVLDRAVLPALQTRARLRTRGCFSAFQAAAAAAGQPIASVAVELLAQSGQVAHPLGLPPLRWFLNLNTPQDLERAEALAAQSHRVIWMHGAVRKLPPTPDPLDADRSRARGAGRRRYARSRLPTLRQDLRLGPIIVFDDVSISFDGRPVLEDVSFSVSAARPCAFWAAAASASPFRCAC